MIIFGIQNMVYLYNMKKTWFLWILAAMITVLAAYFQRTTGPTHSIRLQATIAGSAYTLSCPRSALTAISPQQAQRDWEELGLTSVFTIKISSKEEAALLRADIPIRLHYKRTRSQGDGHTISASIGPDGRTIQAVVPSQPPAGKLAYYLEIDDAAISQETPIVIRFRNNVPVWALIPHILFMFAAMFLSTLCGLIALRNDTRWRGYAMLCLIMLLIGGLILGPITQKFAFGTYWTGWPLGDDLTDTKTLFSALFWVASLLFSKRKYGRSLAILAAVVLLVIFSIPHSASGSEFNYETGVVETAQP